MSRKREGIPGPLDELVMRLLSSDPLGRPASAAEIMDRVGRIVPSEGGSTEVAHGYLASTTFVGCQRELVELRARLEGLGEGRGASMHVTGPSGGGKSRLLRELAIEMKLHGVAAVIVEDVDPGPYAVVRAIVERLLEAAPLHVLAAFAGRAARLTSVLPALAAAASGQPCVGRRSLPPRASLRPPRTSLAPAAFDHTEERLAVQGDIHALLLETAKRHPLGLVIDDIQRADEASVAVLSGLAAVAHQHSILLVTASVAGEAARASEALESLVRASTQFTLSGLSLSDVELLVTETFGAVPNVGKLAHALHEAAGGSPLFCVEVLSHLVAEERVRYLDGMWIVPDDVTVDLLPKRLDDTMDARVAKLSPDAKALAQAIALFGRESPLDLVMALGAPRSERIIFDALDELVGAGILLGDGRRFRVAHAALKSALQRGEGSEARRLLHGRVADALSPWLTSDAELDGEVGHHLLLAGRNREAAALLAQAGRRLYETQALRDAVPVLEEALEAYGDEPTAEGIRSDLRQLLVVSGLLADRDLVLRRGEESIQAAWRQAGLDVGGRVGRFLGPLGILAAVITALCRRVTSKAARHGPMPLAAIRNALVIATASFIAYSHLRAFDRMNDLLRRLALFSGFERTVPHTSYRLTLAAYELVSGNRTSTRKHCDAGLLALASDRWTPLSGYERLLTESALRATRAWVAVIDQDPAFADDIGAIEAMELPSSRFQCATYRTIYHRLRGEENVARVMEAEAERIRVQLGAQWMWEGALWQQSSLAYAITRDPLGLKRCIEELTRMERRGYFLADYLALARANYLKEHGELESARVLAAELFTTLPERSPLPQHVLICSAEVLLALGDAEESLRVIERARLLASHEDRGQRTSRLRLARLSALCRAALGAPSLAFAELDIALADAEDLASPALAGALHEAGTCIAVAAQDEARARTHREGAERWFQPTASAALIGRLERLRSLCERPVSSGRTAIAEALSTIVART